MTSSVSALLPLNLIPLDHAFLCANCDVVSESRNGRCVACQSPSLISLSQVLGRMEPDCGKPHRRPQSAWANQGQRRLELVVEGA